MQDPDDDDPAVDARDEGPVEGDSRDTAEEGLTTAPGLFALAGHQA